MDNRVSITDFSVASNASKHIILGKSFVFLSGGAFKALGYSWLKRLFSRKVDSRPHVISLLGPEPVQLPGMLVQPVPVMAPALQSITTDKMIYRSNRDFVNVLVLNPVFPRTTVMVEVRYNGGFFSHHLIETGANGEARLTLKDLPVGDFEILFAENPAGSCKFTVAEYKLVPLVAHVTSRVFANGTMSVTLLLETYGVPAEGAVKAIVFDRDQALYTLAAEAVNGECKLSFLLTGEGPHSIALQLADDAGKTATVVLPGTGKKERSTTLFSPLGVEVYGSLLPGPESREVRGLYLQDGAVRTSPVTLERVDEGSARLHVHNSISVLKVVLIDPAASQAGHLAVEPSSVPHPSTTDPQYKEAERMYQRGKHQEALELLIEARSRHREPHPYYSYYIACCYAARQQKEQSLQWLQNSIVEGWSDFDHLSADPDLAVLHGWEPFEVLANRGYREVTLENLTAGQAVELDVFSPVTILALGAYVDGKPWEGWASVVTPPPAAAKIVVDSVYAPGATAEIKIEVEQTGASAYVVVKDARLKTSETPLVHLASAMKNYVEQATRAMAVGFPTEPLSTNLESSFHLSSRRSTLTSTGQHLRFRNLEQSPATPGGPAAYDTGSVDTAVRMLSVRQSLSPAPDELAPPPGRKLSGKPPHEAGGDEQESHVLYADFVELRDGKGTLSVVLPDSFGDYTVECFAISGMNWAYSETGFRAEADPFVDLTLPLFAREGEAAQGLAFASTTSQMSVQVIRDNNDVVLQPRSVQGRVSLEFPAAPGAYQCLLQDESGNVRARCVKVVQPPGKLKRQIRSVRFLEKGDSLNLADDDRWLSLKVLPGADRPLKTLAEATTDYGYACCEQTAAKVLSACLMYLTAAEDNQRRKRAEAAILAGITREKSMWLPGRGFKMYPELPAVPHEYYTPKVALYLFYATALSGSVTSMSRDLKAAFATAEKMAVDASRACGMPWPPARVSSCEDAYAVLRFGSNGVKEAALDYVTARAEAGIQKFKEDCGRSPYLGAAVFYRAELAFAAASLLRGRGFSGLPRALELAAPVVESLNESGMLYSTVDSIAALAMLSELDRFTISGELEIDGMRCSLQDALTRSGSIQSITAVDGTIAVEVTSEVIDDWDKLDGNLQVRVALEKDGRAQRTFDAGDLVELRVKIESGYKDGDLLWVCLPDVLSRVVGGGQLKLFSVDFRGKDELVVPLAVTGKTRSDSNNGGMQSFAVCVRNMFDEERGASAGLQQITVN